MIHVLNRSGYYAPINSKLQHLPLGRAFELKNFLCDQRILVKFSKVTPLLGFSLASVIARCEKFMILNVFRN